MNLILTDIKQDKAVWQQIGALYKTAFPPDERAPFWLLRRRVKQGRAQILVAYDAKKLVGFTYLVIYRDLVYLFYFAIDSEMRGQGYGSAVLQALRQEFPGRRIFLAREQLDEQAENAEQRRSRHEFYLFNGFCDWPCQIKEASVIYDVMGMGGDNITPAECQALIDSWGGSLLRRLIDMRVLAK